MTNAGLGRDGAGRTLAGGRLGGIAAVALAALAVLVGGCGQTERTLTVTSEPAGAHVIVNGVDKGRTPVTFDFLWYGDYRFELSADGYETLKTNRHVRAPVYQWVGADLLTEALIPVTLRDDKHFHFTLEEMAEVAADELILRAQGLRDRTLHSMD